MPKPLAFIGVSNSLQWKSPSMLRHRVIGSNGQGNDGNHAVMRYDAGFKWIAHCKLQVFRHAFTGF